jgi:hypothetical protein
VASREEEKVDNEDEEVHRRIMEFLVDWLLCEEEKKSMGWDKLTSLDSCSATSSVRAHIIRLVTNTQVVKRQTALLTQHR